MAATASASPIISASRFVLSIDNVDVATFSELIGISSEVEPGPDPPPFGKANPPTVTLRRGVDGSTEIWAWHQLALEGSPAGLKTCALKLQNANGQTLLTFIMENAWPSQVDIAGQQAGASQVMMETDEFVCDSLLMQPG